MFSVYNLQSLVTEGFYIGHTYDLEKRLNEHNSELVGHTKKEQPWGVAWSQIIQTRTEAMVLVKRIKKEAVNDSSKIFEMGRPVSVKP